MFKDAVQPGVDCYTMEINLHFHIDYLQMNVKAEEENNQARPDLVKS